MRKPNVTIQCCEKRLKTDFIIKKFKEYHNIFTCSGLHDTSTAMQAAVLPSNQAVKQTNC